MSRGPGRWQRAILDELERREQFFLRELLPEYPTRVGYWTRASPQHWVWEELPRPRRSEAVALYRAAYRLAARRVIALDTSRYGTNHRQWTGQDYQQIGRVIVARPGLTIDRFALMFAYQQAGEAERRRRACEYWRQRQSQNGEPSLSVVQTETTTLNAITMSPTRQPAPDGYSRPIYPAAAPGGPWRDPA
jgi:hypothetical protein